MKILKTKGNRTGYIIVRRKGLTTDDLENTKKVKEKRK